MMKPENCDELRAKRWLELQGYSDIRRPSDDPPDYVVEERYAVEVRRLNRPEEDCEIALRDTVQEALAVFGPPTGGQAVFVDCDYPFLPPLPVKKVVKREVREAIKSAKLPEDSDLDLEIRLKCGIRLLLGHPVSSETVNAKFMVNDVSVATPCTGWVQSELIQHIPHYIKEKAGKVRKKDRVDDYSEWWLLLVDYIEYVACLREFELKDLREAVQFRDFWKRIVIISPEDPKWFYEL